jgi:hypothetical protein
MVFIGLTVADPSVRCAAGTFKIGTATGNAEVVWLGF